MGLLNNLFSQKYDLKQLLHEGAIVVDVRTPGEFQAGHIDGSKNIPLSEIENHIGKLKALKVPVILCCASGIRSGSANTILKKNDIECYNGGGWKKVNRSIS